jgi:hypothetical protein
MIDAVFRSSDEDRAAIVESAALAASRSTAAVASVAPRQLAAATSILSLLSSASLALPVCWIDQS